MLVCQELVDILKTSRNPVTIKYLARKLNTKVKTVNATFRYLRDIEQNKNIVVQLRSPHSVKKRPIYSYHVPILTDIHTENIDNSDDDSEELNNIKIED